MSLSLALNNALSGLRVNQESISVLSQNIANVNTDGYSRQVLNQSAVSVGNIGEGVQIDSITRKIDAYLQRSVVTQTSANQSAQTLSGYYTNLQSLLGQPGAANSIDTFMTSFFNSVQQLAETPDTNSLKANAVAAGSSLANTISALAGNVNALRQDADGNIATAVASINASLKNLTAINQQLAQTTTLSQGQSNSALLDARDKELNTLAGYMDINTTFDSNGAVTIVAGSGAVLVEQGTLHQLQYTKAGSANTFTQDSAFAPLQVLTLNNSGAEIAAPQILISGGTSSNVKSTITGGSLAAFEQVRDKQFPAILDQLDTLAAGLRDAVNTLQNQGSGYPPATSLTGDRALYPTDASTWSGQVRIAVLKPDGSPVVGNYADEPNGIEPLTIDLSQLNSGNGAGTPTLQTIVDEINNHFGAPGNKAEIGNLNNVQLVSDNKTLPQGAPDSFNFDLDLNNLSGGTSNVFVSGITVLDDTGTNITNVTQTVPSIALQPTNSYSTTAGSSTVMVNLTSPPTVKVGDTISMSSPGVPVDGIPAADLTGFFTVTAVSGNTVSFTAAGGATGGAGGSTSVAGVSLTQPYATVLPGQQVRTVNAGQMQVNLSANSLSNYYDITVNVSSVDANGVVTTAPVTYRVPNNVSNNLNARYDTTAVGAPGKMVLPNNSQGSLTAIIVDANGNELPKVNGQYVNAPGYLKLVGGTNGTDTYGVAIDEMNSAEAGDPNTVPATQGTGWGFSHYFGLNNFFASNNLTNTGDTVKGSASNLKVQQRLLDNANLISTGNIEPVSTDTVNGTQAIFTYARYSGNNSIAQAMAQLNTKPLSFMAAGGLPTANESLLGYTSDVLGSISQISSSASSNAANAQTLYDGFKSRSQAVSGVNLDEELANTVVFQNAYSATARVITIVNQMYSDLLQAFG